LNFNFKDTSTLLGKNLCLKERKLNTNVARPEKDSLTALFLAS